VAQAPGQIHQSRGDGKEATDKIAAAWIIREARELGAKVEKCFDVLVDFALDGGKRFNPAEEIGCGRVLAKLGEARRPLVEPVGGDSDAA
jgi:hypothetical protein